MFVCAPHTMDLQGMSKAADPEKGHNGAGERGLGRAIMPPNAIHADVDGPMSWCKGLQGKGGRVIRYSWDGCTTMQRGGLVSAGSFVSREATVAVIRRLPSSSLPRKLGGCVCPVVKK